MKKISFAVLTAALMAASPALAQQTGVATGTGTGGTEADACQSAFRSAEASIPAVVTTFGGKTGKHECKCRFDERAHQFMAWSCIAAIA